MLLASVAPDLSGGFNVSSSDSQGYYAESAKSTAGRPGKQACSALSGESELAAGMFTKEVQ